MGVSPLETEKEPWIATSTCCGFTGDTSRVEAAFDKDEERAVASINAATRGADAAAVAARWRAIRATQPQWGLFLL